MEITQETPEKVKQVSVALYPRHERMLREIRTRRGTREDIPTASSVMRELIEDVARRELSPERFEEVIAGAA